jgi:heptaprenyl diphosphate synthase
VGEARVILMQQTLTILTEMKENILQKISLPYLQKYIQTPNIDEDMLLLIISMLEHHGLTELEMEDFIVTPMLIQIALDTHETISNSNSKGETESNLKQRQLTVLGGIYYSSLYYKILSNTNNLAMIRQLAEGIKDINEHKILLYQKDFDGIEKLMNSIMKVESSLIKKLADYFHETKWNEISCHFLFMKRLLKERKCFTENGSSLVFESLRKVVFPKCNVQLELSNEQRKYLLIICDKYIDFSTKIIEGHLKKLPSINEALRKNWSKLLLQHNPIVKTYVEEG